MKKVIPSTLIFISTFSLFLSAYAGGLPKGFVYIDDIIPDISIELRYAGNNNFIGQRIEGYESRRCIITADAAYALKSAQNDLKLFGLGLKIYDAFRPQRAVDHFIKWANDTTDIKMKEQYYPSVRKSELFENGYISRKSGHSRGSTVDLTLIDLASDIEIDMGSPYDFFDEKSNPLYSEISAQQKANRLLLNWVITEYGFIPSSNEWWHFTLQNEPFEDTYFDFVIE
jgi:D-alanyl-D-alanine dipeptidase